MLGGTAKSPPGGVVDPEGAVTAARPIGNLPDVEVDEGPEEEPSGFRQPLPPSDRIWRHPSEVGTGEPSRAMGAPPPARSRPSWPMALATGALGAGVAVGLLALTGALDQTVVERIVVEREAVVPAAAASSPPAASIAAVVRDATPAIVRIEVIGTGGAASGSGVLFRNNGYLITNAHVVDGATRVNVVLADGTEHDGTIVGADPESDIAVVKIDGTGLPTVLLGRASSLEVGQPAIAIGSPLGLEGGPSVTVGIVSALNRSVRTHGADTPLGGMIQTDASIAAGSSGGGLFDANGTLIGITTAVALTESGAEGLGFAIPVEEARRVAEQLVNGGTVARVWLGVRGADMTTDAEQLLGTPGGAMLREVVEGGPAAVAGLSAGDVITKLGDVEIDSMSALVVTLRSYIPGETVPVTYLRDGVAQTATVTLVERPANP